VKIKSNSFLSSEPSPSSAYTPKQPIDSLFGIDCFFLVLGLAQELSVGIADGLLFFDSIATTGLGIQPIEILASGNRPIDPIGLLGPQPKQTYSHPSPKYANSSLRSSQFTLDDLD